MVAIRWTDLIERQLLQIRTRKLGEAVLAAVEGLAQFPHLGRQIPEGEQIPQLAAVRDIIVKETVGVLYEYDEQRKAVWILAFLFPGQELTLEILGLTED
ncbi:type II toxin-antitoxin system RelE/ParE family toxin [Acidobacteriia bacterium AH_259_A11_L15]|nr:type II toxin-antitoxin system RelE/ParE family toxin [Acidobacteriia bacterium AH_259_A11_L15]